jgi:hypothetical protein
VPVPHYSATTSCAPGRPGDLPQTRPAGAAGDVAEGFAHVPGKANARQLDGRELLLGAPSEHVIAWFCFWPSPYAESRSQLPRLVWVACPLRSRS